MRSRGEREDLRVSVGGSEDAGMTGGGVPRVSWEDCLESWVVEREGLGEV